MDFGGGVNNEYEGEIEKTRKAGSLDEGRGPLSTGAVSCMWLCPFSAPTCRHCLLPSRFATNQSAYRLLAR